MTLVPRFSLTIREFDQRTACSDLDPDPNTLHPYADFSSENGALTDELLAVLRLQLSVNLIHILLHSEGAASAWWSPMGCQSSLQLSSTSFCAAMVTGHSGVVQLA